MAIQWAAEARRRLTSLGEAAVAAVNRPVWLLFGAILFTSVTWAALSARVPDEGVYVGEIIDLATKGTAVARSTHPVGAFSYAGLAFVKFLGVFGLSALFSIRLLGALCVAATAFVAYLTLRRAVPDSRHTAVAAMAFTGLSPMFVFIGASGNSDTMLNLAMATLFFAMVDWLRRGPSKGAVALVLAAAAIGISTKERAYVFLPLLIVVGALHVIQVIVQRHRSNVEGGRFWSSEPGRVEMAVIAMVAAAVVFRRPLLALVPSIGGGMFPRLASLGDVSDWLKLRGATWLAPTFWADFGYLDVWAPRWLYSSMDVLVATAIVGIAMQSYRGVRSRGVDGIARLVADRQAQTYVLSALALALAVYATAQYEIVLQLSSQGRYLFVAMVPIALMICGGIFGAIPRKYHGIISLCFVTAMFLLNWYTLLYVTLPATF